MKPKPDGGKKKNVGSPTDAAQRQVRALYGKAVATSSRNASTKKRIATTNAAKNAATRPTRGGGSMASSSAKSSRADNKSMLQQAKGQSALKAKLKGVDYEALGRLMAAKGYGLPKTK